MRPQEPEHIPVARPRVNERYRSREVGGRLDASGAGLTAIVIAAIFVVAGTWTGDKLDAAVAGGLVGGLIGLVAGFAAIYARYSAL